MNTKLLIGLGGVAAVVLLALFVVMPLLSTEDVPDVDIPSAAAAEADAAQSDPDDEAERDAEEQAGPVDETFEVFTARDPFQQLVSAGGGSSVTPIGSGGGDGDSQGGAQIGHLDEDDEDGSGVGDSGSDGGEGGSGGGGHGSGTAVDGTVVQLVEVFEDTDGTETVQVTVNGSGYEVTEGDDFARRFRVLDISGQCATFLYGDQRFTLCEGETIRK
jgi:hypothetical protein